MIYTIPSMKMIGIEIGKIVYTSLEYITQSIFQHLPTTWFIYLKPGWRKAPADEMPPIEEMSPGEGSSKGESTLPQLNFNLKCF